MLCFDFEQLARDLSIQFLHSRLYDFVHRSELFRFKVNMYKLQEEREISPKTFAHMVSSTLYSKRYEWLVLIW